MNIFRALDDWFDEKTDKRLARRLKAIAAPSSAARRGDVSIERVVVIDHALRSNRVVSENDLERPVRELRGVDGHELGRVFWFIDAPRGYGERYEIRDPAERSLFSVLIARSFPFRSASDVILGPSGTELLQLSKPRLFRRYRREITSGDVRLGRVIRVWKRAGYPFGWPYYSVRDRYDTEVARVIRLLFGNCIWIEDAPGREAHAVLFTGGTSDPLRAAALTLSLL